MAIDLISVAIYGQGELKRVSEADRIVSMMLFPSPADREPTYYDPFIVLLVVIGCDWFCR